MAENQEQDEDEENAPEPLRREEALALARKGKDAWNSWANKKGNTGREVDFAGVDFTTKANEGISFEGFTFPGDANFSRARFGTANFEAVVFNGEAKFIKTVFRKSASFQDAEFRDAAYFVAAAFEDMTGFSRVTFGDNVVFGGSMFAGPVEFDESRFKIVPDFRRTDFKKHVTLHGIGVDFRQPTEESDADKYRRLKELAVIARDHEREQMFFAYELIAKRGHETRGLKLIPNYLYEWTSDFGRSLRRPIIGLFVVWSSFAVFYGWIASKDMSHILDGLLFSAAQLMPFLGASKGTLNEARKALFGVEALSVGVNALGMLEGGLGILFLFLIGLALRNRFRI